jgi:LPXTG-motif cell wall-anchored protein
MAFNYCAVDAPPASCSGDTAAPVMTSDGQGEITATGSEFGTVGSTAWFQPSDTVKSIVITMYNLDIEGPSNVRIWVAQGATVVETPTTAPTTAPVTTDPASALAATGANTAVLPWGLAALVAGAAALVLVRRRSTSKQ